MTETPAARAQRWSQAAADALDLAIIGGDPRDVLSAGLADAPGYVWRVIALEWIDTARESLTLRVQARGGVLDRLEVGGVPDDAPASLRAACDVFGAMLNGDRAEATRVFTATWNNGSTLDAAVMVFGVLRYSALAITGGGDALRVVHVSGVPDTPAGLEE